MMQVLTSLYTTIPTVTLLHTVLNVKLQGDSHTSMASLLDIYSLQMTDAGVGISYKLLNPAGPSLVALK